MKTVVLACGGCRPDGEASAGLRCRLRGSGATFDSPARYDAEEGCVTCLVPQELASSCAFTYEVVDGRGAVLCRSVDCCRDAPRSACATAPVKTCEQSLVLRRCTDSSAAAPAAALSDVPAAPAAPSPAPAGLLRGLGWVDRLLPVWILAAMVLGVLLGVFAPGVRDALAVAEIGGVSLPIALGLWIMMLPVLTKVRYELLGVLLRQRGMAVQFGVSAALNWLIGPALCTGLAWACLPDLPGYRNGVILVGLARCIAMVLIWNELARGHTELCAVMVAFNSVLQVVLYSPLALLYLNVVSGSATAYIGFWPVAKGVLLFLGVPLVAGVVLRCAILAVKPRAWFESRFMPVFGPFALLGLLYTIVIMFASQGAQIVQQFGNVARVAVPMLLYFAIMFTLSMGLSWRLRMSYEAAVTQAFTAASNNFELAIAVAVAAFGIASQEALAATIGPLIEVPVLLGLVHVALWARARLWRSGPDGVGAAGAGLPALPARGSCGAHQEQDPAPEPRVCEGTPDGSKDTGAVELVR